MNLSDEDAVLIRQFRANGTVMRVLRELPLLWGHPVVSLTAVKNIVHGVTFRDAGGPVEPAIPLQPAQHGSVTMYGYGCRCGACTAANKARCLEWRERNPEKVHQTRHR